MSPNTLLIELGTEELPPKSLNKLRLSLATSFTDGLDKAGLTHGEVHSYATPRRLALVIESLVDQQPDQAIERRGPATKAAFDTKGNPTKALTGFMKSCGVTDPDVLEVHTTDKGEWLMYRATKPGDPVSELLTDILRKALDQLPIDRRMRWGDGRTEFVRPAHWLVSLYGDDVMPITILGLTAGRQSKGHRFMSQGTFDIASANDYVEACRSHAVVVSFEERRSTIREGIIEIAATVDAELEIDEALLDEVTSLVEWPVPLMGSFDESFLAVPPEVLISAMKEHQRYFHLTDPVSGRLLPRFITISNIASSDPDIVISGNERVIRPRLSDANFFFQQDTRHSLEEKLNRLDSVVFQTELGTYGEKAGRISDLAAYIATVVGADETAAARAGLLCKADLVSDMVGEFPDLQGVMGGYYASHDGESDDVVKGIAQHYRPTQAGGDLPDSVVASTVALADKIDTLIGLFGIGQPPTGSRDPFALRRQSLGVIRLCVENNLAFDLTDVFTKSASLYNGSFDTANVIEYLTERLNSYYGDQGISRDMIEATLSPSTSGLDLVYVDEVVRAIKAFRQTPTAEKIIAANKRVANLLKKVDLQTLPAAFDPALATETEESNLHLALGQVNLDADTTVADKLETLAGLAEPVDTFFDSVLVMADDEKVKVNRLTLLRQLRELFLEVADFSLLQ